MSLNLKFTHSALIIQTKLAQDFIQASSVHSETLLHNCICYSNTRGVTTGTLLWSGMPVMGLTRPNAQWKGLDDSSDGWMTLQPCK
jgi:hypothetical protein